MQVTYQGASIDVPDVLLDTASAGTLLDADIAADIGIVATRGLDLVNVKGVGGKESVFRCTVDRVEVDGRGVDGFLLEVGSMSYGDDIHGIIGLDFLLATGAVLDFHAFELSFAA